METMVKSKKFSFDTPIAPIISPNCHTNMKQKGMGLSVHRSMLAQKLIITPPKNMVCVNTDVYYQHKEEFINLYLTLKLHWIADNVINNIPVNGWFSNDNKTYLIRLPEQNMCKCFTGNCTELLSFLTNLKNLPITPLFPQKRFIGADLEYNHNLFQELLRQLPVGWRFKQ